jgi:hypothetical protein
LAIEAEGIIIIILVSITALLVGAVETSSWTERLVFM